MKLLLLLATKSPLSMHQGDGGEDVLASRFSRGLSLGKRPTSEPFERSTRSPGGADDIFEGEDTEGRQSEDSGFIDRSTARVHCSAGSAVFSHNVYRMRGNVTTAAPASALAASSVFSPSMLGPKNKRVSSVPTPEQMRALKAKASHGGTDTATAAAAAALAPLSSPPSRPSGSFIYGAAATANDDVSTATVADIDEEAAEPSGDSSSGDRTVVDTDALRPAPTPTLGAFSCKVAAPRVAVVAPDVCLSHASHLTPLEHQENYKRLAVLCGGAGYGCGGGNAEQDDAAAAISAGALRRPEFQGKLQWLSAASPTTRSIGHGLGQPVAMADILRVHDWEYVEHVRGQCAKAEAADVAAVVAAVAASAVDSSDPASSDAENSDPQAAGKGGEGAEGGRKKEVGVLKRTAANLQLPGFGWAKQPIKEQTVVGGGAPSGYLDGDTRLSSRSWEAATVAAGAAVAAVDLVMQDFLAEEAAQGEKQQRKKKEEGEVEGRWSYSNRTSLDSSTNPNIRKAFVATRPPGHHAGSRGAVPSQQHFWQRPDMCSCGFCLLNNVAIAAAYARYKFGRSGLRVAIVDFDIHHVRAALVWLLVILLFRAE